MSNGHELVERIRARDTTVVGLGTLIRAQAAGEFASLQERGRPSVRIRLEDL